MRMLVNACETMHTGAESTVEAMAGAEAEADVVGARIVVEGTVTGAYTHVWVSNEHKPQHITLALFASTAERPTTTAIVKITHHSMTECGHIESA